MPEITVHHLNNSKSQRILWVLEELGLPYEIKFYQRQPTMAAPPEMAEVHPLGKAPIVEIDGKVMAESGAIVGFLIDRFGGGALHPPKDGDDWAHYLEMLHYVEGSSNTPFFLDLIVNAFQMGETPLKEYADSQIKLHLDYMESTLGDQDYLVGNDFSGADIQISFTLMGARARGLLQERPKLLAYVERLEARPAWKAAIDKGGELSLNFTG